MRVAVTPVRTTNSAQVSPGRLIASGRLDVAWQTSHGKMEMIAPKTVDDSRAASSGGRVKVARLTSPGRMEVQSSSSTSLERPATTSRSQVSPGSSTTTLAAREDVLEELCRARESLRQTENTMTESAERIAALKASLAEKIAEVARRKKAMGCVLGASPGSLTLARGAAPIDGSVAVSREQAVRQLQRGARAFLSRPTRQRYRSASPSDPARGRWKQAFQGVEDAVGRALEKTAEAEAPGACLSRHLQLQMLANTLKQCTLQVDQALLQATLKDISRSRAGSSSRTRSGREDQARSVSSTAEGRSKS